MTFAVFENDDIRKRWALRAEQRIAALDNLSAHAAREKAAGNWGVSFWTLKNWHGGRLKNMSGEIRDRIDAGIIRELQTQIRALTHEMELALQSGAHIGSSKIAAIRADLAKLNVLLAETEKENS